MTDGSPSRCTIARRVSSGMERHMESGTWWEGRREGRRSEWEQGGNEGFFSREG